jgi:hypothetical protein
LANTDDLLIQKLDARGRQLLTGNAIAGAVEVLVQMDQEPTPQQKTEIEEAGGNIRTVLSDTLSATTTTSQLSKIAQLPFMVKIEISRALFNE